MEKIKINPNKKQEIMCKLKPAFGYLNINSSPKQGANIYIDGKDTKLITPCKKYKISSGKHKIALLHQNFKSKNSWITVKDNITTPLNILMATALANVKINVSNNLIIYVDGEKKGKGIWNGPLKEGIYTVETKNDNYHNEKKEINIIAGIDKIVKLKSTAKIGNIDIDSEPYEAKIYIDGKFSGKTPIIIENIIVGKHTLELKKDEYESIHKTIQITENTTYKIKDTIYKCKLIQITSKPSNTNIYIDSKKVGKTPMKIKLSYKKHNICIKNAEVKKCKDIEVSENSSSIYNFNDGLYNKKSIKITSSPSNADIYIDSKKVGKTPMKIKLSYEEHTICVKNAEAKECENIEVSNFSSDKYHFNVKRFKQIKVTSTPTFGEIYINNTFKKYTNNTFYLEFGKYTIRVENEKESEEETIEIKDDGRYEYKFDITKKRKFFITTNSSIYAPYGIRMGLLYKFGIYISATFSKFPNKDYSFLKSNYSYELKDNELKEFDKTNPFYYKSTDEKAKILYYDFILGFTSELNSNWFLYYGLGYGRYQKNYKFKLYHYNDSFKNDIWVKDTKNSFTGIALDLGLIARINHFTFSAGISSLKVLRYDFKFGLGIIF